MGTAAPAVVVGLLSLLILLSGLWLSRIGRPLNPAVSAAHKLVSVAAGVYLLVTVCRYGRATPLTGHEWIAVVATGLCFLVMVASGGFLSSDKPMPVAVLRVHQVVPLLTALSTAATLYLLLGR